MPPFEEGTEMISCPVCEGPIPPSKTKPRIYCSHNCRQYAWNLERRAMHAAAVISAWEILLARKKDTA